MLECFEGAAERARRARANPLWAGCRLEGSQASPAPRHSALSAEASAEPVDQYVIFGALVNLCIPCRAPVSMEEGGEAKAGGMRSELAFLCSHICSGISSVTA